MIVKLQEKVSECESKNQAKDAVIIKKDAVIADYYGQVVLLPPHSLFFAVVISANLTGHRRCAGCQPSGPPGQERRIT